MLEHLKKAEMMVVRRKRRRRRLPSKFDADQYFSPHRGTMKSDPQVSRDMQKRLFQNILLLY